MTSRTRCPDPSRVALAGLALAALVGWAVIRPVSDEHVAEETELEPALAVAPAQGSLGGGS